jgi:hypothetical protein
VTTPSTVKPAREAPAESTGYGARVRVLTVNAGSSSLKLRLVDDDDALLASAELPAQTGRADEDALREALEGMQFATEDGAGTSDVAEAQKNPDGSPMSNPARQIWVTETALTNALYTSYFAENVALFAIIVGIAMLLVGVGFLVLTLFARRRPPDTAAAPPSTAVAS